MAAHSPLQDLRRAYGLATFGMVILCFASPPLSRAEDRTSVLRRVVIEGRLDGDVTCFACSVVVNGEVTGDVVTLGGDITIHGIVGGDAVASGGSIHMTSTARIGGDLVAVGGFATADTGASAQNTTGFVSEPWVHVPGQRDMGWRGIVGLMGFHLACILFSLLLLRPRRLHNIALSARRWISTGALGAGVLIVFTYLFDVASNLRHFSNALESILSALFLFLLATGIAGAALALGELLSPESVGAALAIGGMTLIILELIPVAGLAIIVLLTIWALGAAVLSGVGFRTTVPQMQ